jgi:hypothetical protein
MFSAQQVPPPPGPGPQLSSSPTDLRLERTTETSRCKSLVNLSLRPCRPANPPDDYRLCLRSHITHSVTSFHTVATHPIKFVSISIVTTFKTVTKKKTKQTFISALVMGFFLFHLCNFTIVG